MTRPNLLDIDPHDLGPDIVLITTDTQGREMLSCYGERRGVSTPNLDRLASHSIRAWADASSRSHAG